MRNLFLAGAAAVAIAAAPVIATAQEQRWVSTWGTALEIAAPAPMKLPPPPPEALRAMQTAKSPIIPAPKQLNDETVRMIVRTTLGGKAVRLQLSNAQGRQPLRVGAAHVGIRRSGSAIAPGAGGAVTFAGKPEVTIPPGAIIASDPIALAVSPMQELAVSLYLPQDTAGVTAHPLGLNPTYIAKGNVAGAAELTGATAVNSYFWLAGVEVLAEAPQGVIVAFGDSITDGYATTPGAHRAWPELLAERLQGSASTAGWAVVNMGISGNRLLRDGAGASALARFDRDVLSRPGVKWIVLLEGINDINLTAFPGIPEGERATADSLIAAYSLFIDKAHLHGIKVMAATLTPTEGLWLHSAETEAMRQALNQWIRTSGKPDAVVDFDAATRDPARPARLRPEFNPGDNIHPNDAGNAAMAAALDLSVFGR